MFIGLRIAAALRLWTATQCDVILNLLGHSQTTTAFPACLSTSGSGSIDPTAVVAIQASFASSANLMAALQIGYDSSILLALLVHDHSRSRDQSRRSLSYGSDAGTTVAERTLSSTTPASNISPLSIRINSLSSRAMSAMSILRASRKLVSWPRWPLKNQYVQSVHS